MKEWFKEVNDYIREGLPLMIAISWMCMVVFIIKLLLYGQVK